MARKLEPQPDAAPAGRRAGRRPPHDAAGAGPVVVGIGTSAGGLQALIEFLEAVPGDSGMAFVVVQHLDPNHPSLTAELLGRRTAMPVTEVEDDPQVAANRVYVIPPNRLLTIEGGRLHVLEPSPGERVRAPVDHFLRSLAAECRERAVGMIFSGSGSDGSQGLREVKAEGGMTIVQEPATAEHDGMPRSAVATGAADHVLTIAEMPEVLLSYAGHPYVNGGAAAVDEQVDELADPLADILEVLRTRTGYDFRRYKKNMLLRRIQRRMGVHRIEDYPTYLELLRTVPEETGRLVADLLIGVTAFFREPEAFAAFAREAAPAIIGSKPAGAPVRVWVPACATGEEAYSIAMVFLELLAESGSGNELQIFATDIDDDALRTARAGVYPEAAAADVPADRLARFFTPVGKAYRVKPELREAVLFAKHNLIANPPFTNLDLVSCRNLLIYLEQDIQSKIAGLFHFALNDGGFLFLGTAESVAAHHELFEPVVKKWRLYRRIGVTPAGVMDASWQTLSSGELATKAQAAEARQSRSADLRRLTRQELLEEHTPPAVLINRKLEVLYFHGNTSRYLLHPAGEPSNDLTALARDALGGRLRAAARRAVDDDERVVVSGARLKTDEGYESVRITVSPLHSMPRSAGLLLVTFEDDSRGEAPSGPLYESAADPAVEDLERELQATRRELQSTIEELETANQELKNSNEEVLSGNEELKASNEELETSKEELQTLNEELTTVNNQLQRKLAELEASNNDVMNLLRSSQIGTLFLDREQRVKRFTDTIQGLYNLIPADVGRPIDDLTPKFSDPLLAADIEDVLGNLEPVSREVEGHDGRWYLRRVMPYRTGEDRIEGVVVTFTEVTELKRAQLELETALDRLERAVARRSAVIVLLRRLAEAANDAGTLEDALAAIVPDLAMHLGARYGQTWLIDEQDPDSVVATGLFFEAAAGAAAPVIEATPARRAVAESPLAADVMERRRPLWSVDLEAALGPDRGAAARRAGLQLAMMMPVLTREDSAGYLELLLERAEERREYVVELATSVGIEIGRVLERVAMQRKLSDLSDEEQRRLGKELHDTVAQEIAGIRMLAEVLQQRIEDGTPDAATAAHLAEAARQAQGHVRSLARGLVPATIAAGGLRAAIEQLAERMETEHGVACEFVNDDDIVIEESRTATNLYYIAQEAVNNAVHHGGARQVTVTLERAGDVLHLRVTDDGCGFQADQLHTRTGSGLRIMEYRARLIGGSLTVDSAPGSGATVTCRLAGGAWTAGSETADSP